MKLPGWARRENQLALGAALSRVIRAFLRYPTPLVPLYSELTLSARAAAKGQKATETRLKAARNSKAALLPGGAATSATPKISTGIDSGRIRTGPRRPPRRRETVTAAPMVPS